MVTCIFTARNRETSGANSCFHQKNDRIMKPLVFERTYEAPVERVWEALTNKAQMREWYFDVSDFKPEPGFRFYFTGESEGIHFKHECEVVEAVKPEKLSYTWRYEGYPGQSLVTFELFKAEKNSTRLKLTHSGTDTFTHPDFGKANWAEGWSAILGESLRNFVEKEDIKKSILIDAPTDVIWNIILNPNHQWGKAFGGGAFIETDWKKGSSVIWRDTAGDIGASGILEKFQPETLLHIRYYDDVTPAAGAPLGDYSELIHLSPNPDGTNNLHIEAGLITKKDIAFHAGMWDQAMAIIKDLAEKQP